MLDIPSGKQKIIQFANEQVENCRASQMGRAALCRSLHDVSETGRQDGATSKINTLHNHLVRYSSHLFSPTDLRFTIDYENEYPRNKLDQAKVAARILTRDWERNNTDMLFGQGVFEGGKYGWCGLKQWVQSEGQDKHAVYHKQLVMPWQFGVSNESQTDLSKQDALCETIPLTLPEVWRRIYHLPDAEALFKRIKGHADRGQGGASPHGFNLPVMSTSVLSTPDAPRNPGPGGIVGLGNVANYPMLGPTVAVDMVNMHELWVQGEDDYVTIQIIEPDILIAPLFKKANLLISGEMKTCLHPYTTIQPNPTTGYLWGRSELLDLISPQLWLSTTMDDIARLLGVQFDKVLAFPGDETITDEKYDQARLAGYFALQQGASVTDLTPKFPPEAIPLVKMIMEIINIIGGFPEIMQGKGEPGVRAGVHANTLLKTASPGLRDGSLLVERQCAQAADLRLTLMEAKDASYYWSDGTSIETIEKTKFLLHDIPDDRRVSVDSHSSSPIFADDHAQLVTLGLSKGFIDGHGAIDLLPYPQKELLHANLKAKEEAQKQQMDKLQKENPELFEKMMLKRVGGKH